jgi:hypothetical protein
MCHATHGVNAAGFDLLRFIIYWEEIEMLARLTMGILAVMLLAGPALSADVSYRLETPGVK